LIPIPRQQAEHTGGHTNAVLRSVTETFVKCVVLTNPDRMEGERWSIAHEQENSRGDVVSIPNSAENAIC
jgi:hypothetical protein